MSNRKWYFRFAGVCLILAFTVLAMAGSRPAAVSAQGGDDPNPPENTVKLIFIHHSTGENWLRDDWGGLGRALGENNYFVSDTNYGWGPDTIGDRTDIPNWPEWFTGPESGRYMEALYNENEQHSEYTRGMVSDPRGENEIILFKSCFPNSNLDGSPDDPPQEGYDYTVSNAKWIYNDLLYVQNMSFWLDVKIAALTFLSVARGGSIPLSWLLRPEKYGERRAKARAAESVVEVPSADQPEAGEAVTAPRHARS